MRKSAVLVLNPPLSLVIINYIFVQEGINATYRLSSFEVKKAQTCNNFCAVLLIGGGGGGAGEGQCLRLLAGVSRAFRALFPSGPAVNPTIRSRQGTPGTRRRRGAEVTSRNYNVT